MVDLSFFVNRNEISDTVRVSQGSWLTSSDTHATGPNLDSSAIDLELSAGTDVFPFASGRVVGAFAGYTDAAFPVKPTTGPATFANYVTVEYLFSGMSGPVYVTYAHLSRSSADYWVSQLKSQGGPVAIAANKRIGEVADAPESPYAVHLHISFARSYGNYPAPSKIAEAFDNAQNASLLSELSIGGSKLSDLAKGDFIQTKAIAELSGLPDLKVALVFTFSGYGVGPGGVGPGAPILSTVFDAGSSIFAVVSESNVGSVPTLDSRTIGFYLSSDSKITTSDLLLGTRVGVLDFGGWGQPNPPTGGISGFSAGGQLPTNLRPGTYYFGAVDDISNQIKESNESNNASAPIQITITGGNPAAPPLQTRPSVSDGYVAGATVFADANENGLLDSGEAWTFTDASGHFDPLSEPGRLIAFGGTDTSTGLPFNGTLSAPTGYLQINGLTSLVASLQRQNISDAEATVISVLAIDPFLDIASVDLVEAASEGNAAATKAYAISAEVINSMIMIGSALAATADQIAQNTTLVLDALASVLASHTAEPASLADEGLLTQVVSSSAQAVNYTADPAFVSALVETVSASNAALELRAEQVDPLNSIATIQHVAQGIVSNLLRQAGGSPTLLEPVLASFTGAELEDAITSAADPTDTNSNHAPFLGANALHRVFELPSSTSSNTPNGGTGHLILLDVDEGDSHTATATQLPSSVLWTLASSLPSALSVPTSTLQSLSNAFAISDLLDTTSTNNGEVHWAFSIPDKFLDFLGVGEALALVYEVAVTDSAGTAALQPVAISIEGSNDIPTVTPDSSGVSEGGTVSVAAHDGVLANDSDPDISDQGDLTVGAVNGVAANVGISVQGTYGALTLNLDGSYTYIATKDALPSKIVAQDTFAYTTIDRHGDVATSQLDIIVFGQGTGYQSAAENTTPVAVLNSIDLDTVQFSITGGADAALFEIVNGTLAFIAARDYETDAHSYQVEVTASDGVNRAVKLLTVTLTDVSGVTITGTAGNDTVDATTTVPGQPLPTPEGDVINGLAGSDQLDGGAGADAMIGGLGDDTYTVDQQNDAITEVAGGGVDTVISTALLFTLPTEVENLTLATGTGNTFGVGNGLANVLLGNAGINTLVGNAGADTLDGGAGADYLLGGVGNDLYKVDHTFDLVDEGGAFPAYKGSATDFDTISSTAEWFWDVYSVGERLRIEEGAVGSSGAGATIVGSVFSNEMIGNRGTNIMFGRGGADTYRAGDGVDWISLDLLGVTEENAYVGVDGVNTIIVDKRATGELSYDIIFEFEVGKDKIDVSSYGYATATEVILRGHDDAFGNSYYALGDGFDYIYLVGVTTGEVHFTDFVV